MYFAVTSLHSAALGSGNSPYHRAVGAPMRGSSGARIAGRQRGVVPKLLRPWSRCPAPPSEALWKTNLHLYPHPAVLATTMVFSGVAAAAMHPSALADWLHNPAGLQAVFSGGFPWQQVRRESSGAAVPGGRSVLSARSAAGAHLLSGVLALLPAFLQSMRNEPLRAPARSVQAPNRGLPTPAPARLVPAAACTALSPLSSHLPMPQVLYCGLLTTDLALLMEVLALQDVSSVEAAIIYTLEPVLGAGVCFVAGVRCAGYWGWVGCEQRGGGNYLHARAGAGRRCVCVWWVFCGGVVRAALLRAGSGQGVSGSV